MSTVTVVKKNGVVAIAADTQTSYGPRKVSAAHNKQAQKILKVGQSYLGLTGWAVNQQVLEHMFRTAGEAPAFASVAEIFDLFLSLHVRLKQDYFMSPRGSEFEAYESSQVTLVIANRQGIFGVYPTRDVFEYERFWSIGSGSEYALGAMLTAYDTAGDARAIAEAGVRAGVEFDSSSGAPIESYVVPQAPAAVAELELLLKM